MTEVKPKRETKSSNWGGRRQPGPGKKLGKPAELNKAESTKVYLDEPTRKKLDEVAKRVDGGSRSGVIRHLVKYADIVLARYPFEGV